MNSRWRTYTQISNGRLERWGREGPAGRLSWLGCFKNAIIPNKIPTPKFKFLNSHSTIFFQNPKSLIFSFFYLQKVLQTPNSKLQTSNPNGRTIGYDLVCLLMNYYDRSKLITNHNKKFAHKNSAIDSSTSEDCSEYFQPLPLNP